MDRLKSYRASTLAEVIVALVISSILFALAGILVDNLWSSGKSERVMRAEALAHVALSDSALGKMSDTVESVRVVLSEDAYGVSPDVKIRTASALGPGGDTLFSIKKMVRKK